MDHIIKMDQTLNEGTTEDKMSTEFEFWNFDTHQPIAENMLAKLRNLGNWKNLGHRLAYFNLLEYDTVLRECKVYITTRDLQMPGARLATLMNSKSLQHWAVVCRFDNRTLTCELRNPLGELEGGVIVPSWENVFEDNLDWRNKMLELGVAEIGKIVTSPRKIFELVCNHEMNFERYDAEKCNCQHWVMQLLTAMSEGEDQDLFRSAQEAEFVPVTETWFRGPVEGLKKIKDFCLRMRYVILCKDEPGSWIPGSIFLVLVFAMGLTLGKGL